MEEQDCFYTAFLWVLVKLILFVNLKIECPKFSSGKHDLSYFKDTTITASHNGQHIQIIR